MDRKRNNPTWCCDQIEEKIKDYKLSLTEIDDDEVRRQLEIVIDDLESILYGQIGRDDIVKEFRNTDEITKEDLEKMYNAIVKFDNYISLVTRKPTDENIELYEHWIDCRYDIEKLIVTERQEAIQ